MDDSAPQMHADWIRYFQNLANAIQKPLTAGMIPDIPFGKIAMTLSPRLLGRTTAGAGAAEQISVSAPLTLASGALGITGSALTRVNDTNITATLGGSPTTALLAATSITLGWTGTLAVTRGGTNIASYAVGDLLYADTTTTLAKLADVSAGSYLRSGGITTAPVWSTAKLPNTSTTGDVLYASAANTYSNLADVAVGSYLRSGGVTTAPLWSTLTLPNAATTGDLTYASSANAMAMLAIGSAANVLTVSGGLPVWAAPAAAATTVIVDDTTTNASMFPTWVTASSGSLPLKVTSTKLSFNPSTGLLSTVALTASGAVISDTPTLVVDATNHRVGVGTASPAAKLSALATTEQLRVSYDASNYTSLTNTSNGRITVDAIGTSSFIRLQTTGDGTGNIGFLTIQQGSGTAGGTVIVGSASGGTTGSKLQINTNASGSGGIGLNITDGTRSVNFQNAADIGGGISGSTLYTSTNHPLALSTNNGAPKILLDTSGRTGFGVNSPTAVIHIKAGTATANTGPLKFNSGTNLTTAEAGTMEYDGTDLFFTRAGTVRENVLVAIDNVAAPTTTPGVVIVNYYGANSTNYLGDPNRWLSVNVLGATYKIPLYN